MKKCFKCGVLKELNEFYKHPQMTDGHVNKCKECNKKDVIDNRNAKIDYYTEYDRNRANLPHRIKARKDYSQTESGKLSGNNAKKRWSANNLIKRSASYIVKNAVRDKRLIKSKTCESCGDEHYRIHGHHDDYNYPMIVRWLCPKCHNKWHKENGSGING
jgi:ribosomal protein S27AE